MASRGTVDSSTNSNVSLVLLWRSLRALRDRDAPHILRFEALVSPSEVESLSGSDSSRSVGEILCGGVSSVPSAVVDFVLICHHLIYHHLLFVLEEGFEFEFGSSIN